MTQLFDSLVHQPISEDPEILRGELTKIKNKMALASFSDACVVRMVTHRDERLDQDFAKICGDLKCFTPIALVDPHDSKKLIDSDIKKLSEMGYKGIKIHPRTSKIDWSYPDLAGILRAAHENKLASLLCTYMHADLSNYPVKDPFYAIVKLLKDAPAAKILLLHGGDVELLKYAELARFNSNLLLDLSFTMMKYAGSSIDADIRFLFHNFDERICIGTDYPQYRHEEVKARFDFFAADVSEEKKNHIGSKNIKKFFDLWEG